VLAVTEFGMNVRAAVDAPRMHQQWMPDTVSMERRGNTEELLQKLRAMGHTVNPGERSGGNQGDANSIGVDAGGAAWGASDKRSPDGKTSVARSSATAVR
jgi:gamma-glutamyltranspeptidase/glutathione hydrolase